LNLGVLDREQLWFVSTFRIDTWTADGESTVEPGGWTNTTPKLFGAGA